MAIESILNLGISGSELIATKLKNLKKSKDDLGKKTTVNVGLGNSFSEKLKARRQERKEEISKGVPLATKAERDSQSQANTENKKEEPPKPEQKKEPSQYGQDVKAGLANAKNQAASSILSFNGTGLAQAAVGAVASLIPVIGTQIGQAINYAIDAMKAFKEKIKQQASIVADTQAHLNTIKNSFNKESKLKNFEDFIGFEDPKTKKRTGRNDLTVSEQASIANAISGSMGKVTDDFASKVSKLFVSSDGKTSYDIGQSTSLAQGNFASLGTDKGFFMQQISNGFSGLPPSMKQALTGQMFSMISDKERDKQTDVGIREVQATFDNITRTKASEGLGENEELQQRNIGFAIKYENIEAKLDNSLQKVVANVATSIGRIATAPDLKEALKKEAVELAKGAFDSAGEALKGTLNSVGESFSNTMNKVEAKIKGAFSFGR